MHIINFSELNSTSVYAKEHLEELNNFDVISCDLQTLGHGQFERVWYSSDKNGGNIYISIVLKPENISRLNELTRYTALIVAKTLEEYSLKPSFKYPNDVLVNNKKISGILAQSQFSGSICHGVVLGIGINLNLELNELEKIDQPATSIFEETKKKVDKKEFLDKFLSNFKKEYDDFLINGIKGEILC